jgi:hypothetical protein
MNSTKNEMSSSEHEPMPRGTEGISATRPTTEQKDETVGVLLTGKSG